MQVSISFYRRIDPKLYGNSCYGIDLIVLQFAKYKFTIYNTKVKLLCKYMSDVQVSRKCSTVNNLFYFI